jgi:predicted lipid-binding transport protein (Tim44 family)
MWLASYHESSLSRKGTALIEFRARQCQMRVMAFFLDPLNLVLIAIAAFAGFKLWQVLGLRTGAEPLAQMRQFKTEPKPTDLELKPLAEPKPVWDGIAEENSDLAKTLQSIGERARGFNGTDFLKNSISAHERVMEAFAAGNATVLKLLLNAPTFKIFESEITRRAEAGEKHEFRFVSPEKATLVGARLNGDLASLDVAYTSQVISAIKNKDGALLSGDDKRIVTLKEIWTFERGLNALEPNWRLADTRDDA